VLQMKMFIIDKSGQFCEEISYGNGDGEVIT
jgi:hypothetical protein